MDAGPPRGRPLIHGLQLAPLPLVLPRRLRAVPAAAAPRHRTGCCSSPATTSTRRGTGASSACCSPRRSSTTPAAARSRRDQDPRRRTALLCLSLGFNLTLLGFFKYFNFFADNLHGAVRRARLAARLRHAARAAAGRHLVLHVRDDELRHRRVPPRDPADAEPAGLRGVRRVLPAPGRRPDPARDRRCCRRSTTRARITRGADARRRVAHRLGVLPEDLRRRQSGAARQRASSSRATHHTGINVLLGVYAFAFQIYGDFAGYSNIARGTSKLMGIELIENFRFPYFVRTPQEFWRNWHISLSTWLRDYLYIPLGGNRGSGVADATQPADHDGARRAVARRGLDVRALGPLPRRAADRLSLGASSVPVVAALAARRRAGRARARLGRHVPPHLLRLADLPGARRPAARDD